MLRDFGHSHPPTQGTLPDVGGIPLLSSSDVHEIRLGARQFIVFAEPLMMWNTFHGDGLV